MGTHLERLTGAKRFQSVAKSIVKDAMDRIQERWSARHAVHVWDLRGGEVGRISNGYTQIKAAKTSYAPHASYK